MLLTHNLRWLCYLIICALISVWSAQLSAEQWMFSRKPISSDWLYNVGFLDSRGEKHISRYRIHQYDVESAVKILRQPDQIGHSLDRYGAITQKSMELKLSQYADSLLQDVLNQAYRYADQLMDKLPSGSRIHINESGEGSYVFEGHLARDYRVWKYKEYANLMQWSVRELKDYFQKLAAERNRAIDLYRNDLQKELQSSVDQMGDQLMNQSLLVKNQYHQVRIDYRAAVRKSLWHLRSLSQALDSIGSSRERIEKVIAFFQSIPYEEIKDHSHRHSVLGFRMPVVTLSENLGDCDSKAVGAAAVLKNLMPDRRLLLVLIPEHALLAVQLTPKSDEQAVRYGGRYWVLLEPTGPALHPPGVTDQRVLEQIRAGDGVSYIEL